MRRSSRIVGGVAVAVVAWAGCNGESTGAGNDLEPAEATALAVQIYAFAVQAAFASVPTPAAASPPAVAAAPATDIEPVVATCPGGGGTVTVSGMYEQANGGYSFTLTQEMMDCMVTSPQSDMTYTINTDPPLTISFSYESQSVYSFSMMGGFAFTGEGVSGACTIDLSFTAPSSVSGEICGVTLST